MNRDSKLSGVLHVLLHMADREQPMTSEQLAQVMHTNPVVVRRVMAGLRDAGFVHSSKGHGGGWLLACDLDKTTLHDVYLAVGAPGIIALGHRNDNPACLVERAVNHALGDAIEAAEALLLGKLAQVRLSDLAAHFSHHHAQHKRKRTKE